MLSEGLVYIASNEWGHAYFAYTGGGPESGKHDYVIHEHTLRV